MNASTLQQPSMSTGSHSKCEDRLDHKDTLLSIDLSMAFSSAPRRLSEISSSFSSSTTPAELSLETTSGATSREMHTNAVTAASCVRLEGAAAPRTADVCNGTSSAATIAAFERRFTETATLLPSKGACTRQTHPPTCLRHLSERKADEFGRPNPPTKHQSRHTYTHALPTALHWGS